MFVITDSSQYVHLSIKNTDYKMNLRIVTNGSCLLRCKYCHKEGALSKLQSVITINEIVNIYKALYKYLPIKGITISGYEPFHYVNIFPLIKAISKYSSVRVITSGAVKVKMPNYILESINTLTISIPSFEESHYKSITRQKEFSPNDIIQFISSFQHASSIIEINVPIKHGLNDGPNTIKEIIQNCQELNVNKLRFILIDEEKDILLIEKLLKILNKKSVNWLDHRIAYLSTIDDLDLFFVRCTIPPYCFDSKHPSDIYLYTNGQIRFCLNSSTKIFIQQLLSSKINNLYNKWRSSCYIDCVKHP